MILFTWNLHRTERALRLALEHLAGLSTDVIAVVQELPDTAEAEPKAQKLAMSLTNSRVRCLGIVGPGRVGFFASSSVSIDGPLTSDQNHRLGMAVLKSPSCPELHLVGVHSVDRRNVATEGDRGAWGILQRQAVERFWKRDLPFVVMGDFNAEPYHTEVSGRMGLLAVRDRDETEREWPSPQLGGLMRPLYNPMWSLLGEVLDGRRPRGTFHLDSHDQGIRWRICDQILVSKELIPRLEPVEILERLCGESLTTCGGNPCAAISDHLPVQLTLK